MEMIGPMIGLFWGVCLIIFRKTISNYITKGYEKFPKYEYGVKTWKEFENVIKAGISTVERIFNKECNKKESFKSSKVYKLQRYD